MEVSLYTRLAGSQLGSSALFGSAFFASTLVSDGLVEAATVGSIAAVSWLGTLPLLKRLIGATARA